MNHNQNYFRLGQITSNRDRAPPFGAPGLAPCGAVSGGPGAWSGRRDTCRCLCASDCWRTCSTGSFATTSLAACCRRCRGSAMTWVVESRCCDDCVGPKVRRSGDDLCSASCNRPSWSRNRVPCLQKKKKTMKKFAQREK